MDAWMRWKRLPGSAAGGTSSAASPCGRPAVAKARRTVVPSSWRSFHQRFRSAPSSRTFRRTSATSSAGAASAPGEAPGPSPCATDGPSPAVPSACAPPAPGAHSSACGSPRSERRRSSSNLASRTCCQSPWFSLRSLKSARSSSWGMPRSCAAASARVSRWRCALPPSVGGSPSSELPLVALHSSWTPSASSRTRCASFSISRQHRSQTSSAARSPAAPWPPPDAASSEPAAAEGLRPCRLPSSASASCARTTRSSLARATSCSLISSWSSGSRSSSVMLPELGVELSPLDSVWMSCSTRAGFSRATCSRSSVFASSSAFNVCSAFRMTPSDCVARASSPAILSSRSATSCSSCWCSSGTLAKSMAKVRGPASAPSCM
mmetsp:Transcript_44274/g.141058  ORF Transcript_44274/g.141058 Transcript_44274/m.141058 type:complete len:379 (-) Transcript_44274:178-1314(-)